MFSPPGKEEESAEKKEREGRKRRGPLLRCPPAAQERGGRRGEGPLAHSFSFSFFFFFKGGVSLCKPMTQPHMVRSRPYRYFSLQIGSLRGLAATRKCILALRAAEGAGQGRHSPAQPRASLETLGTRRGPAAGGVTSPSFLLLLFHVGHATWGDASSSGPRHGPRGSPGSIRPPPRPLSRPALYSAPRLQLPPGPRAGHGCRPRLVRSGAGRPQGALALPDPRSGRPSQGGSAGCGARGDWSMCWNLPRCVRYEKPTVFTHLEMSFCCLDVAGAILKALPRSGHQAL